MNFGHIRVLWVAAIIVPLLILFLWVTWRKRAALIRQFVQHKTLMELSLGVSPGRQKIRRILLVVAVVFLLLTVARPQWGFVWEEATQQGRDIVIAIDTSRSMLAADVQPNRLARAKLAALDLMKLGKYDRFGLVAFAGTAFLQCPLTFDEEAFRQSVQILEPGILPQGGTALSAAIEAAREAFGEEAKDNHKVVVLFTDGEDHEAGVMETVQEAANANVRIFTIGAGTPGGEVLRVRDEKGELGFIKDSSGNVVKSRLNESLLRDIATTANGFYLPLNAPNAMEVLYAKGLAPMPTSERSTKLMKRLNEQFHWPLSLAVLLLIVEIFVPEQKRAPRRKTESSGKKEPSGQAAAVAAMLLLLLFPRETQATPASALQKYKSGEFKGALSEYQKLLEKSPQDPKLNYNAGAAAYQANKLDEALERFRAAAASPDLDLQQQSFYNLGNTEYRQGESNSDIKERMASWEQAIQNYETALRLNSSDHDASFNRDLVKQKLEALKKQEQEKKQQDPNDQNKDEKDEKNEEKNQDQQDKQDKKDGQEKDKQQQSQDQKSDEQKEREKQEQKKQQSEQEEQKKKEQQQAQNEKGDEKKPEESQPKKEGGKKDSGDTDPQEGEEGQFAQAGKMTPAQAKQLLDAQRSEEKALLFIPQDRKSAPQDRVFKDW